MGIWCLWRFSIFLECEAIKEIPGLPKLQRLRTVEVTGSQCLVGIQGLGELVSLEVLDLSHCEAIKEIPDLSMLWRLVELKLSSCQCQLLEGIPTIDPEFV